MDIPKGGREYFERLEKMMNERIHVKEERESFDNFLIEAAFTRTVDNFLSFIADMLALVFEEKPEALKSNETKRVDWILSYNSLQELVAAIAEEKVVSLSYLSIKDLDKYLGEKTGLALFDEKEDLEDISLFNEYRNLFVHNRGIVNSISKKKSNKISLPVGAHISLTWEELEAILNFINAMVVQIESRFVEHFNLPTPVDGQEFMESLRRKSYFELSYTIPTK